MLDQEKLMQFIQRYENAFITSARLIGPKIQEAFGEEITGDQFFVLQILTKEEKVTSSQLAKLFNVKPSAITAMIDRMYKNDLVLRNRDEKDRRVVFIELSEKGKEIKIKAEKKRMEIMKKYYGRLEENELLTLIETTEKLTRMIQEDLKEDPQ
ncbi:MULTISPECIES: MarR family winged helix-turn-helix transcriptional regulator [Bacillus]|uniref:MarR family winged helix-turn-helix transcriptional regulator n=1 Tax=Bacillus TaxID=1386 RepID=UPI000BB87692|nr:MULTISPECIES: MarR family transcriptional regulator [Bacillus]